MKEIVGLTGTRNGLTQQQFVWLNLALLGVDELHHGACIGADEAAHNLAAPWTDMTIIIHPPEDERLMMDPSKWLVRGGIHVMSPKPYHDRNRDIVNETQRMLALPDGPERPKGGTWYTVRYAVEVGKPVTICYPDGEVEER